MRCSSSRSIQCRLATDQPNLENQVYIVNMNEKSMIQPSPLDTVNSLTAAINQGDLDAALNLYEPDAVLVAQPGQIARGRAGIREALAGFVSLKPTLRGQAQQIVDAGDIVLYCSRWTLTGTSPDGGKVEMAGVSSDILRRQYDGRWLIVIDNPWGTSILS
ncbi:MAG TPA: SgcJ/EcaC family oxidoreductase [Nitrososphaera sp.]|nr:SgcJ/EcaC family oxidoreductase [Nitrososphaera sp.]